MAPSTTQFVTGFSTLGPSASHTTPQRIHHTDTFMPRSGALNASSPLLTPTPACHGSTQCYSGTAHTYHVGQRQRNLGTKTNATSAPRGIVSSPRTGLLWSQKSNNSSSRNIVSSAAEIARVQDAAEDALKSGRLVEFKPRNNSEYMLGLILGPSTSHKQCWEIEDESGAVHVVNERNIALVLPGGDFSLAEMMVIAKDASAKEKECTEEAILSMAWELSQPGAMYTVPEMASLLFRTTTPAGCSAAHRLLLNGSIYFKQAGRRPPIYAARSEADVKSLKIAAEKAKVDEELQMRFIEDVEACRKLSREQRHTLPCQQEWKRGIHGHQLQALETFALGKTNETHPSLSNNRAQMMKLLCSVGVQQSPQGAAELLQSIGYWPLHTQLPLLASGLTEEFSAELESYAAAIVATPPPDLDATSRVDLTHLHVVTIDDESTTEIDDGLSVEFVEDDKKLVRVWVHVADPTRWVTLGDPLDMEAKRRSKTLYLPTGMIPMFPLSLATGPFSLRQGFPSCALTVSCVINLDNGEIAPGSVQVTPSTILPTQRLTYEGVDEMLEECTPEEEPALHALAAAGAARRQFRLKSGAVEIAMPEPNMTVINRDSETPDITMEAVTMVGSPSRELVAEMMILAGEVCARLGASLGVPLPYRGQNEPVLPSDEELHAIPAGPCRMAALRSAMTRSITSAGSPQRHAGLGLDAYVQVTSPIRRYGDLLAHWQLKAALRGEKAPLTVVDMSEAIAELTTTTQRVSKLERDAQSYWVAHYFKNSMQKDPDASWEALILGWFKQEAGLARVLLQDSGLESLVKVARPAVPGVTLRVKCTSADPLMGVYRLDEVMSESN